MSHARRLVDGLSLMLSGGDSLACLTGKLKANLFITYKQKRPSNPSIHTSC